MLVIYGFKSETRRDFKGWELRGSWLWVRVGPSPPNHKNTYTLQARKTMNFPKPRAIGV